MFFGLSGSILIFLRLKSSFFLVVILAFFGVRSGEFGMFWVLCNCREHAYFLMIFCHIFAQGPFISGGWQNRHFFNFIDQLLKTFFRRFLKKVALIPSTVDFWGLRGWLGNRSFCLLISSGNSIKTWRKLWAILRIHKIFGFLPVLCFWHCQNPQNEKKNKQKLTKIFEI